MIVMHALIAAFNSWCVWQNFKARRPFWVGVGTLCFGINAAGIYAATAV